MSDKGRVIYGFDPTQPLTRDLICGCVHADERAGVHAAFDRACAFFIKPFNDEKFLAAVHDALAREEEL